MAEASTEIGLAPCSVQELCTACEELFHASQPGCAGMLTDLQAVEAFTVRVTAAVVTMLDTQVRTRAHATGCGRHSARRANGRPSAVEDVRHER